jgi:hypothetical protein
LLSSWSVAFEAVDVQAHPARWADLARLGVTLVPATVVGDRVVHGWNPRALAELVGAVYVEPQRLPPAELLVRLDRVLAVAARSVCQVPPAQFGETAVAGRDRPVRQLAYHTFRLSLAFPDAIREHRLPETWLNEAAPPTLTDPAAVAAYGDSVRARLAEWKAGPSAWAGVVETYYGPQTGHELLERTVWHAAQHVRQLQAFLTRIGITPADPLRAADLRGLPLPADLA